jgi:carboxypeptidase family protein
MPTIRSLRAIFVCSLVLAICPLLYGQATGSFSGTVEDKTGSVVAGASVKVTSQGTGVTRDAKTDGTGHYVVPLLPVASYTIRVEASGFQAAEQKDIRLQVDEHREVNFTMAPGSVSEKVEVSATEVAVQTTNPTLGQVITEEQVAQLPLNGRNFVQLATLTPGTTQETNPHSFFNGGGSSEVSTRGSFSLSVGGSRASSTDWLLDGNDNNELTAGGISILPSIDAIQEFKVLTYNYSAQYGTRAGPTVLVNTKGGSNQFHGSLFEFLRNTKLDARSFFAANTEKFNLNQFGGSLGGPIQREKTFFFVDYQGRRLRQGRNFFGGFVPTAGMRTGDFTLDATGAPVAGQILSNPYTTDLTGARDPFFCDSAGNPTAVNADGSQVAGTPCNKIPAALFDPAAQAMMNFYPLPNITGNSAGNFVNAPAKKLTEDEFDVRIDHNFSSKDSIFGRFSYDQASVFLPGGSDSFAEPDAFSSTQNIENHGRNVAISETHIFSGNTVNQINVGYNRIFNFIRSFGDGSCVSDSLGIPNANLNSKCPNAPSGSSQSSKFCVSCGLVSTIVGGAYWNLGDRGFAPFQGGTNVFHIADSFDMIRGKHNIKIGAEYRANQMNVMTNAFQDGFYVFTSLWAGDNMADFLLGLPDLAFHDQTFKGATTGRRWKLFRPYVQDDWRVTPNLTLNLGLAWALVTPITEAQNRQANFDFASGQFFVPGFNSDGRVGIQMDKKAFEPRIGIAWKPMGSDKTAIRAGYAIFHDSSWNQGGQGLWENPPFFQESAFFGFTPGVCPAAITPLGGTSQCAAAGVSIPFVSGRTISFGPPSVSFGVGQAGFPILTPLSSDPSTFGFSNIFSQNRDFKQGMVQQYNLNVERQLPGEVVLTVGYAGSRSTHILVDQMNLNATSPLACSPLKADGVTPNPLFDPNYTFGCGLGLTPPFPNFGNIQNANDIGSARYDSLQIKAETKSMRHGLYALLGYTWARAFDSGFSDGLGTGTGATYFPLPGTAHSDWALSQINLNHSFTASVIYDLPFGKGKTYGSSWSSPVNAVLGGWQVNVIEKITSGFPVFIVTSTNNSGVNFTNNTTNFIRPDQVGNPFGPGTHTPDQWFTSSAFVNPPDGQLGTANRAPLYGPGFVNTDFSLNKRFPIHERTDLEFRAEFFNLFNHPQFFTPVSDKAASNFGQITETVNNPRLVQFALKLRF